MLEQLPERRFETMADVEKAATSAAGERRRFVGALMAQFGCHVCGAGFEQVLATTNRPTSRFRHQANFCLGEPKCHRRTTYMA